LATHPARTLRVALAAPTGKAAARLRQAMGEAMQGLQAQWAQAGLPGDLAAQVGAARTLHALLGARPDTRKFAFGPARPLALDVLIVDEASMVHLEMMARCWPPPPASLLGDKDQLASGGWHRAGRPCHGRTRPVHLTPLQTDRPGPAAADAARGTALAQKVVMLREQALWRAHRRARHVNRGAGSAPCGTAGAARCVAALAAWRRACSQRCTAAPGAERLPQLSAQARPTPHGRRRV
jgi:hypothetical protein